MAKVLVAGALLFCDLKGPVTVTPSQSVLKVNGKPVLLAADLVGAKVACPNAQAPCTSITSLTDGASTVLKVNGKPVALKTATGPTAGGTFKVDSPGQTALDSK